MNNNQNEALRLKAMEIREIQQLAPHHIRLVLNGASLEIYAPMQPEDAGPRIEWYVIEGGL